MKSQNPAKGSVDLSLPGEPNGKVKQFDKMTEPTKDPTPPADEVISTDDVVKGLRLGHCVIPHHEIAIIITEQQRSMEKAIKLAEEMKDSGKLERYESVTDYYAEQIIKELEQNK